MIRVELPIQFRSPLERVIRGLSTCLPLVAPSSHADLAGRFNQTTLRVLDEPGWQCYARPDAREICITVAAFDVLWCYAYFGVVFYNHELSGRTADFRPYEVTNPEVLRGKRLFQWAFAERRRKTPSEWPADLAEIVNPLIRGPLHNDLDALTLTAIAFMLLHELGHVELRHHACGDSIDQERDADKFAAELAFKDSISDDDTRIKRSAAVSTALLLLVAVGIYGGGWGGLTHPQHYNRLSNMLTEFVPPNERFVWGYLLGVLVLHCSNARVPALDEPIAVRNFREAVDAYIDYLSREAARQQALQGRRRF